ncbi:hypothetical protein LCL85_08490 [Vibrio alginolyticus]|nr:hypothetical protein [Vibrio alginolyticus]
MSGTLRDFRIGDIFLGMKIDHVPNDKLNNTLNSNIIIECEKIKDDELSNQKKEENSINATFESDKKEVTEINFSEDFPVYISSNINQPHQEYTVSGVSVDDKIEMIVSQGRITNKDFFDILAEGLELNGAMIEYMDEDLMDISREDILLIFSYVPSSNFRSVAEEFPIGTILTIDNFNKISKTVKNTFSEIDDSIMIIRVEINKKESYTNFYITVIRKPSLIINKFKNIENRCLYAQKNIPKFNLKQ